MQNKSLNHITVNECNAIKSLSRIEYRTNSDVLKVGNILVRALLSRYLRRQRFTAIETDEQLESLLELWLQKAERLHASGVSVPLISVTEHDGLTPLEIYVVLVLYMHHSHRELQDLCARIHSNAHHTGIDVQLMEDLFEMVDTLCDNEPYYQKSDIRAFLNNRSVCKFRNNEQAEQYDVCLTSEYLRRLEPGTDVLFSNSPYYTVFSPRDILFATEDIHLKLLDYCSTILRSASASHYNLMLYGQPGNGKKHFARYLASSLGVPLCELNVSSLLHCKTHLWHQIFEEIPEDQSIVLLPNVDLLIANGSGVDSLCRAIANRHGVWIFTTTKRESCDGRFLCLMHQMIQFDNPDPCRRKAIFHQMLPDLSDDLLEQFGSDYLLSAAQIEHACGLYQSARSANPDKSSIHQLSEACNAVLSQSFDGLALETNSDAARLSRFVLPPDQMDVFETILRAAKSHGKVMHEWGFARHLATGKGLCILFDGAPGTGKTFAAEVIANELHRPLQRVDMSNLVSKWVGETGENIVKLFAAARANQSILLLDEADALLSKRTAQTSKSTDRYANMEINIILQEIERYDGITILTTNLGQTLDEALERRIQYRITFKEPGVAERQKLWRTLIAPEAQVDPDINYYKLARDHALCGGHIKNAILHAAHLAATENRPISEQDLMSAAMIEWQKLGRLVKGETAAMG